MGCTLSYPSQGKPLRTPHKPWDAATQYLKLDEFDGAEMAYVLSQPAEQKGSTAPLAVLVHGIAMWNWCMQPLSDLLTAKGYQCLRMDLLGRGASDLPAATHNAAFYAKQIYALLKGLDMTDRPFLLIGHSMGGGVSVAFSAAYPSLVKQLVLLAPAGFMKLPSLQFLRDHPSCGACLFACTGKHSATNFPLHFHPDTTTAKPQLAVALREAQKKFVTHNPGAVTSFWLTLKDFPLGELEDEVKTVGANRSISTLILWGDADGSGDTGVPYAGLASYKLCMPNATTITYPKYHHYFFVETPERVCQDILEFVAAAPKSGSTASASAAAAAPDLKKRL